VAIYLDANVLWSWRTFEELDRVAVSIIATQTGQQIRVPKLAAVEAEANLTRILTSFHAQWEAASTKLEAAFELSSIHAEPAPDVDSRVLIWRERLPRFVTVFDVDGDVALEALEREAWGTPPARRVGLEKGKDRGGVGARDAAIWLAIAKDHAGRGEESHFISANVKDFAPSGDLHSRLVEDLGAASEPLAYYSSVRDFLSLLGEPTTGPDITISMLQDKVEPTLKRILALTLDIPIAVYGPERVNHFSWSVEIQQAEPTEIVDVRHYRRNGDALAIVDSHWSLKADCFRQHLGERSSGVWEGFDDVPIIGSVQLYLPEQADGQRLPQIISARLETDHWDYVGD
jgi:hypothetical protein